MSKREWLIWIQLAREKANTHSNITSAQAATGLVLFDPNRVLNKLKMVKVYNIYILIRLY